MPPDPRVNAGVSAWIENDAGELLLMKRIKPGCDGFQTWAIPGGWLDFGESDFAACKREVFEETGLDVQVVSRLGWTVHRPFDRPLTVVTLVLGCVVDNESEPPFDKEPDKSTGMNWFSKKQMLVMDLYRPLGIYLRQIGYFNG